MKLLLVGTNFIALIILTVILTQKVTKLAKHFSTKIFIQNIAKQKQTHREQTDGYHWGEGKKGVGVEQDRVKQNRSR